MRLFRPVAGLDDMLSNTLKRWWEKYLMNSPLKQRTSALLRLIVVLISNAFAVSS